MKRNHRPVPFPRPIPAGVMPVSADIPMEMWEDMKQAGRRRVVDVDHLIFVALSFAATA